MLMTFVNDPVENSAPVLAVMKCIREVVTARSQRLGCTCTATSQRQGEFTKTERLYKSRSQRFLYEFESLNYNKLNKYDECT